MDKLDLTGMQYGRLEVLHEGAKKKWHRYWVCKCLCGDIREYGQSNLREGKSTSCGCFAKELAGETYKSKFQTHGDHKSRLYRIHKGMVSRCTKTWDNNFVRYGAVGITVHPDWVEYISFKKWALENGYNDSLTIDRINGDKGYYPENCQWVDYVAQTRNRRKQTKPASSIYIGVSKEVRSKKWLASIRVLTTNVKIGLFDNELSAAKARDAYIKEHQLKHFRTNF